LVPAWTYHTGDLKSRAPDLLRRSKFEVTPILVGDKLVPLHRGFDGFKFNGGLGGPRARPGARCCVRRPGSAG
jgi:quinoprotein glucose dehydrogenase